MIKYSVIVSRVMPALTAAIVLAGCGGKSLGILPTMQHTPAPVPQGQATLATMILKGSPGFVNSVGHTVYVFDADLASPGQSVCNGACAANWPPVGVPSAMLTTGFSSITRADGSKQLAFDGRPLYTFAFDVNVGDTNGDGVNAFGGLWHIARP